jgi:hypothetical protein
MGLTTSWYARMVPIRSWRIALPSLRDVLPVLLEAGAQLFGLCVTSSIPRRHHHIDRRQTVLVQAKGLTRESFDPITCHRRAEGARRYRQSQAWTSFLIGHDRQTKVSVTQFLAALPYRAKFGRLM